MSGERGTNLGERGREKEKRERVSGERVPFRRMESKREGGREGERKSEWRKGCPFRRMESKREEGRERELR